MKFFTNKIDWTKARVTQDKNGIYYINRLGQYWGTTLDKFKNATAPKGFTKKFDGSHQDTSYLGVNIKKQMAVDISGNVGDKNTFDFDVRVEGVYASGVQKYVVLGFGVKLFGVSRWKLTLVHNKLVSGVRVGQVVKAGRPVTELVYHHTHAFMKRFNLPYDIQKLILGK
jgi:hypothetical protein